MLEYSETTQCETVIFGYGNYIDGKITPHKFDFEKTVYLNEEVRKEIVPCYIGHSYQDIDIWVNGKRGLRAGKENTALWHMMCDRDVIQKYNIKFDESLALGEDTIFSSEYLCYTQSVSILDRCLYYLCIREGSANTSVEVDPVKKTESKIKLLEARYNLGKRMKEIDLFPLWQGTAVLSAAQLAIELGMKTDLSVKKKRRVMQKFLSNIHVKTALNQFKVKKYNVKGLTLFLLQRGWGEILLMTACVLPKRVTAKLIKN